MAETIFCTNCGARCSNTEAFCPNCGNRLQAAPQRPAAGYNAPVRAQSQAGQGTTLSRVLIGLISLVEFVMLLACSWVAYDYLGFFNLFFRFKNASAGIIVIYCFVWLFTLITLFCFACTLVKLLGGSNVRFGSKIPFVGNDPMRWFTVSNCLVIFTFILQCIGLAIASASIAAGPIIYLVFAAIGVSLYIPQVRRIVDNIRIG